jgi:hypothetical protein
VPKGRGIVAQAQRPVQGGGQDAGDSVIVLWCRYEHGVVGAYLLPKLLHGLGDPLVLYVLVEVGYPAQIEALAAHPLWSHLVRRPQDAAVEGGPPEAAGEAEYSEISMVHRLSPENVLGPDPLRPISRYPSSVALGWRKRIRCNAIHPSSWK